MKMSETPKSDLLAALEPQRRSALQVYLVVLDPSDEEVRQSAEIVYRELAACGVGVVMDDREIGATSKSADVDRLALPLRLDIGSRGLRQGTVELTARATRQTSQVNLEDSVEKTVEMVRELKRV